MTPTRVTPALWRQCDAAARTARKLLSALALSLGVRVLVKAPGGLAGGQALGMLGAAVAVLSVVAPAAALMLAAGGAMLWAIAAGWARGGARGAGGRWDPFGPTRLSAPHTPAEGPIAPHQGQRSLEARSEPSGKVRTFLGRWDA